MRNDATYLDVIAECIEAIDRYLATAGDVPVLGGFIGATAAGVRQAEAGRDEAGARYEATVLQALRADGTYSKIYVKWFAKQPK